MPIYTIEAPNGKRLKIEAVDEASALRGAEDYAAGIAKVDEGPGFFGTVDAAVRGAADALTFGFADEISGALGAATGIGGDFGDVSGNVEAQRARDRYDSENAPIARLSGQMAGGVTGGVGMAKNGVTLLKGVQAAAPGASRVARMGNAARIGALSGAEGAAYGAAGGFGSGEGGLANRLRSSASGAALGGALGAAAPGAIALGSKAVRPVVDKFKAYTGPAEKQARERVRIGLQSMGLTDDEVQRRLADLGPDAMLADVMGNRGGRLGRSAANVSPQARETLETALTARQQGQNTRVVSEIERAAGMPVGNRQTVQQMKDAELARRMPEINQAYEAAREAGRDLPIEQFDDILQAPAARDAYNRSYKAVMDRQALIPPRHNPQAGPAPVAPYDGQTAANRVFRRNAPAAGGNVARPQSLSEFVANRGGVKDFKGELRAMGLNGAKAGGRNIVTKSGNDLDRMREAAAEAGYFDHLYGNADEAIEKSTVADFLDVLQADTSGNKVYSGFDVDEVARYTDAEAARDARKAMKSRLNQLGENMDTDLPDEVILRASEFMDGADGLDAPEAIRRAAYNHYFENGVEPQQLPPGLFDKETVREYSNLARLDEAKRILDDKARSAGRAGNNNEAARVGALAKALRDKMDNLLQDSVYADARRLRQELYRTEDALDLGSDLAGSRIPLDAAEKARNVDAVDSSAMARGYAARQAENLLNARDMPGALTRLEPNMQREAMRAALGDGAADVERQLAREKTFAATKRSIENNSTTAQQLYDMGAITGGAGLGMLTGGPVGAGIGGLAAGLARRAASAGIGKIMANNEEAVAPIIASFLIRNGLPATEKGMLIASKDPRLARGMSRLVGLYGGLQQSPERSTVAAR